MIASSLVNCFVPARAASGIAAVVTSTSVKALASPRRSRATASRRAAATAGVSPSRRRPTMRIHASGDDFATASGSAKKFMPLVLASAMV